MKLYDFLIDSLVDVIHVLVDVYVLGNMHSIVVHLSSGHFLWHCFVNVGFGITATLEKHLLTVLYWYCQDASIKIHELQSLTQQNNYEQTLFSKQFY